MEQKYHFEQVFYSEEPMPSYSWEEFKDQTVRALSVCEWPVALTEEEKQEILGFAKNCYSLGMRVSQGSDGLLASKLALAYHLAEVAARKDFEAIGVNLLQEGDEALLSIGGTVFAFDAVRNAGKELGVIDKTRHRKYFQTLISTEEEVISRQVSSDLLSEANQEMLASINFVEMLDDIHTVRISLLNGKDLANYTLQSPYLPLAYPLYVMAKAAHEGRDISTSTQKELYICAFQTTYAEVPPWDYKTSHDTHLRAYWGRLSVLVNDVALFHQNWPAFDFGEKLLREKTGYSYSERQAQANNLSLGHFSVAEVPADMSSNRIDIRRVPQNNADLIASSFGFRSSEKAQHLEVVNLKSTALVDFLQNNGETQDVFVEKTTKGVASCLAKAVETQSVSTQLRELGNQTKLIEEGRLEIDTPSRYFSTRNKLILFSVLRSRRSTYSEEIQAKIDDLEKDIREQVNRLDDIYRLRIYLPLDSIDNQLGERSDAHIYLWRAQGKKEKISYSSNASTVLSDFYQNVGEDGGYGAVVIKREVNGQRCELQIIPKEYSQVAWKTRRNYKQ